MVDRDGTRENAAAEAGADYVVQADVVYAPVGVANGSGTITAQAGSFTVLVPPETPTN